MTLLKRPEPLPLWCSYQRGKNWKQHFFNHALQESPRTGRGASSEHGQHSIACTVIEGGVLITPKGNLAGIELHAVPLNKSGILVLCLPPSWANQWGNLVDD